MKTAVITYIKTNTIEEKEIEEIFYTSEKIVLIYPNGGFSSFFHGDNVKIEIK